MLDSKNRNTQLYAAAAGTAVLAAGIFVHHRLKKKKAIKGPYTPGTLPKGAYDAIIVGAGMQRRAFSPSTWSHLFY